MAEIKNARINKEKEALKKIASKYPYEFLNEDKELKIEIKDEQFGLVFCYIKLPENYPFIIPSIKLELQNNYYLLIDYENFNPFDLYYKKKWTCRLTLDQIIKEVHNYISANIKEISYNLIPYSLHQIRPFLKTTPGILFILLIPLLFRVLISFGSYSGIHDPPQYGDYEAQRHWMELTINTPISEWYIETPNNNLTYWRIDYPPLTAYHSYVLGFFSDLCDSKSMELLKSHGYETSIHKLFMRGSVLVSDILMYFSAIVLVVLFDQKKMNFTVKSVVLLLILCNPGFILIDHGHFQFNCVALGLTLLGFYFCCKDRLCIGSLFFVCALNFKQMTLYYALSFFSFILGRIIHLAKRKSMFWSELRLSQHFA